MSIVRPTWTWSLALAPIIAAIFVLSWGWQPAVGSVMGVLVANLLVGSSAALAWLLSPQAASPAILKITIAYEIVKMPILLALLYVVVRLGLPAIVAFLIGFALVYFRMVQVALRNTKKDQLS